MADHSSAPCKATRERRTRDYLFIYIYIYYYWIYPATVSTRLGGVKKQTDANDFSQRCKLVLALQQQMSSPHPGVSLSRVYFLLCVCQKILVLSDFWLPTLLLAKVRLEPGSHPATTFLSEIWISAASVIQFVKLVVPHMLCNAVCSFQDVKQLDVQTPFLKTTCSGVLRDFVAVCGRVCIRLQCQFGF